MYATNSQFPFMGLHVYDRVQEAWTRAQNGTEDRLHDALEVEIRRVVLDIARATARSRHGEFRAGLETARGAIHAAGAIADQLARRGTPVEPELQVLLLDAGRMLGALVRTLPQSQEGEPTGDRAESSGTKAAT